MCANSSIFNSTYHSSFNGVYNSMKLTVIAIVFSLLCLWANTYIAQQQCGNSPRCEQLYN
ncbi:hypothetical protein VPH234P9_0045 [Vibrio phage 234P9]